MGCNIKPHILGRDAPRLDRLLAEIEPGISRSAWQKAVREGKVMVNGKTELSPAAKLVRGDQVQITELPAQADQRLTPPRAEDIPIDVLYEDDDILAVNKTAGMVVHPAEGNNTGTLVNALIHKFEDFHSFFPVEFSSEEDSGHEGIERPGIVHRLDKDTSGVIIVAKNISVLNTLQEMFKNHEVHKTYLAMVHGYPLKESGRIEQPIGRHPGNRKKMSVSESGKNAATRFSVIQSGLIDNQPVSVLQVQIETGRTHQIRVHLAHIHHPVIGDKTYGGSRRLPHAPRQMLHAWEIKFLHPATGRPLEITSPIPDDMAILIDRISSGRHR